MAALETNRMLTHVLSKAIGCSDHGDVRHLCTQEFCALTVSSSHQRLHAAGAHLGDKQHAIY